MGMIINPYNFKVPLLLDTYPGAAAAYSLRKLRTAYTGYCIEVRRSSDDTTQNIGFTSAGVLDESALTTFCGAGNGFVKTWYDQVGSLNVTQATNEYQPRIVLNGTVVSENSKPTIDFYADGSTAPYMRLSSDYGSDISQPLTLFSVNKFKTSGNTGDNSTLFHYYYAGDVSKQIWFYINSSSDLFYMNAGTDISGASSNTEGNESIYTCLFNGASSKMWQNTSEKISGNIGSNAFRPICIGNHDTYQRYTAGKVKELIMWAANKSTDRSAIETAINSFYSIY